MAMHCDGDQINLLRYGDRMIFFCIFQPESGLLAGFNHMKRIIVYVWPVPHLCLKLNVVTFQFSSRATVASLLVFTDLRSNKIPGTNICSSSESCRDISCNWYRCVDVVGKRELVCKNHLFCFKRSNCVGQMENFYSYYIGTYLWFLFKEFWPFILF